MQLKELVGVYHANGGLKGEVAYVVGKFVGTAHCALCDITHSPVRRKPQWDRMVAQLGIPFTLLHLNELDPQLAAACADIGSPVVFGREADGSLTVLLRPDDLELGGSVENFQQVLQAAITEAGYVG